MCHLLLAGYEDVPSFLNQWKLKRNLILFFEAILIRARRRSYSASYGIVFRILLVKTLVPERCAIFCWQVMKMFHLFLTSGSLKGVLYYSLKIYFTKQVAH